MKNRNHPIYASDIRKAGKERDYYGFDEWSETRINPILGNAVLEVFPRSFGPVLKIGERGELEWMKTRWGLPGPHASGGAPVTDDRVGAGCACEACFPRAPLRTDLCRRAQYAQRQIALSGIRQAGDFPVMDHKTLR